MELRVVVEAHRLPGRRFAEHTDVHVALQVRDRPEGPVPGDAASARWEADVRLVDGDPRGPAVHGRRGERFLYLTWGDPDGDDWRMFRRAKLMLDDVVGSLPADATTLTARVDLTDECGEPRCARVAAPALAWSHTSEGRSL